MLYKSPWIGPYSERLYSRASDSRAWIYTK